MARELFGVDADTGVRHYTEMDVMEQAITLQYEIDAEPMVERNKIARNEGEYDKGSEGWHKYCDVDDVLIMRMLNKGINILRPTPSDWKKFFREIETNYPFYKVTNKKAWKPI